MKIIRNLPSVEEVKDKYGLSENLKFQKSVFEKQLREILEGKDRRKFLVIGPCSADKEDAVLDYAYKLANLAEQVSDKLFIIPRIYTSKPRTTGAGYKGMLHNPYANDDENLIKGIYASRKIHYDVIMETGLFSADEMLYPEEIFYLTDLLGYLAVGARSVENQGHRLMASNSELPVGMKNPTSGSLLALVNSVKAAQLSHRMIFRNWEIETEGNEFAHCILRGYTDNNGKNFSNYHYEDIRELHDKCLLNNVVNPGVIIDCNHSNSGKEYDEQPRIAKEVFNNCKISNSIRLFVKGLMIESYLEDGCQKIGNGIYGKSITDPCLGWEKTKKLILDLADML